MKNLFKTTEIGLTEIFNLMLLNKKLSDNSVVDKLSGEELKSWFAVMELCEAIYNLEQLGYTVEISVTDKEEGSNG